MKTGLKVFCATVFAGFIAVGPALADETFDNAIKARKAVMALYAWNLGQLGAMAKGEVDYNPDAAMAAAQNLKALATMNNGAAWPQGSDSTALPGKTRAKADNWSNYPEASNIHKSLIVATTAMADSADQGLDAVRANIGAIGSACGACHKSFRESE